MLLHIFRFMIHDLLYSLPAAHLLKSVRADKSDPFLSMFIFHCMFAVSLSGQIRRVAIPIPWNDKREKPRWQLK